jgi:hypothetical protein
MTILRRFCQLPVKLVKIVHIGPQMIAVFQFETPLPRFKAHSGPVP